MEFGTGRTRIICPITTDLCAARAEAGEGGRVWKVQPERDSANTKHPMLEVSFLCNEPEENGTRFLLLDHEVRVLDEIGKEVSGAVREWRQAEKSMFESGGEE